MPNQATATAPRRRLAIWAPRMPKLIRLMTGNGTPVFDAHKPGEAEQREEQDGADGQGQRGSASRQGPSEKRPTANA